jgi:hypothetical protein
MGMCKKKKTVPYEFDKDGKKVIGFISSKLAERIENFKKHMRKRAEKERET